MRILPDPFLAVAMYFIMPTVYKEAAEKHKKFMQEASDAVGEALMNPIFETIDKLMNKHSEETYRIVGEVLEGLKEKNRLKLSQDNLNAVRKIIYDINEIRPKYLEVKLSLVTLDKCKNISDNPIKFGYFFKACSQNIEYLHPLLKEYSSMSIKFITYNAANSTDLLELGSSLLSLTGEVTNIEDVNFSYDL